MKRLKKILKRTMFTLLIFIGIVAILGIIFINSSPEFGGKQSQADQARFAATGHYEDGKFVNLVPTKMDLGAGAMIETLWEFVKGTPGGRPSFDLPVEKPTQNWIDNDAQLTELMWFGHSAFLLHIDGLHILLDPMLGKVPAPHPTLGGNRFAKELPVEIAQLPQIDAILISHDHYDHLDYGSIQLLKEKTKHFYVPLGVGAHLREWGVAETQIHELDWWETISQESLKLVFAPSRHFSGRGLSDRETTLWGSWVIQGKSDNIYFSGDGGYGPHFKEIGEKYGPFDFAMMECGQYNKRWAQTHMMPEETAQAALDVGAARMMPIHWGAFSLAMHAWSEPVVRVSKAAAELNMPLVVPKIGEVFSPQSSEDWDQLKWWENKQVVR